jgi:hypothetical protein
MTILSNKWIKNCVATYSVEFPVQVPVLALHCKNIQLRRMDLTEIQNIQRTTGIRSKHLIRTRENFIVLQYIGDHKTTLTFDRKSYKSTTLFVSFVM